MFLLRICQGCAVETTTACARAGFVCGEQIELSIAAAVSPARLSMSVDCDDDVDECDKRADDDERRQDGFDQSDGEVERERDNQDGRRKPFRVGAPVAGVGHGAVAMCAVPGAEGVIL
jgi:hypothetical protein